ncbi:MAG: amidohydrolase family protein [Actinomycetota bacterium]|nr:amidohydrolase family protein [Actinomycetota bacterium]
MLDLALSGPLVDHHCHGLVRRVLDRSAFESLLNEGSGAGRHGTSAFDSMLGLAVRRWCAPVLDLPALCDPDDYLARRAELGSADVDRRFLRASQVSDFVVDPGFEPEPISSPDDLARLAGGRAHQVVRLETLAQDLLAAGVGADDLPARLVEALNASGAVGAKSIAAYRTGLELSATKPDEAAVCAALRALRPEADGTVRIADGTVTSWLAWTAIEAGLPLQLHVGYGDADIDLHRCDPLLLSGFLRGTREREVPVLLLHNYPFHRHASYLAQVFDHVFVDLSLTVHNTGALSRQVIAETLELVPFGKLLYASDAFGLSELYYLGSLLFRRGLSDCLVRLIESGEMGLEDAQRLALLAGSENARRVYSFEDPVVRVT